ncbi:MAG: hypothetical protein ILO53_05620, partial [Clostridia bacterium]|nr:hypothetical protein [Clostridia bacterium]
MLRLSEKRVRGNAGAERSFLQGYATNYLLKNPKKADGGSSQGIGRFADMPFELHPSAYSFRKGSKGWACTLRKIPSSDTQAAHSDPW